ncbi:MAG: UbiA family prenyltransferase [Chitinophagaceae bacterium]|nr:UbiA family prenyltransferase [Chitinophagaceae bacterium]
MASNFKHYLSLVKFSHTIFAMPFAMIGFFLGYKAVGKQVVYPDWMLLYTYMPPLLLKFLLVLVCMITARSAAMAFNRYLDRSFDAMNPRTAIREIPRGIISPDSALRFVIVNCVLFVLAAGCINSICFWLSPVALFVILFYSYTKRFTALCHLVLGLGLSLAPIGAYLALTGVFNWLPILFSLAVITWVAGFDIIYAMQDVEFDASQQLHSIPVVLGKSKALRFSSLLHVCSTLAVLGAGYYGQFHWLYWVGAAVFTGMLVYQHSIVKPHDLSRVNIAFMTANGIASVVFGVLVIGSLFL